MQNLPDVILLNNTFSVSKHTYAVWALEKYFGSDAWMLFMGPALFCLNSGVKLEYMLPNAPE